MSHKVLYHPHHPAYISGYRDALIRARDDLVRIRANDCASHFETQVELRRLQIEIKELRETLATMIAARLAVENAEREVAELRRLQAIGRARAAERDLSQPLQ